MDVIIAAIVAGIICSIITSWHYHHKYVATGTLEINYSDPLKDVYSLHIETSLAEIDTKTTLILRISQK